MIDPEVEAVVDEATRRLAEALEVPTYSSEVPRPEPHHIELRLVDTIASAAIPCRFNEWCGAVAVPELGFAPVPLCTGCASADGDTIPLD